MSDQMNEELNEMKSFSVGDKVSGKVTKVEDNQAFVDVGYKVDGILPISELSNLYVEKVSDVLSVDDQVEVQITKATDEELLLSKKTLQAEEAWASLQQAFEENETIEATVSEVVKGGLVVDVGVRGFIPASLVERFFVEDFTDYKGKALRLKVIELDRSKNKLILSQRAVQEQELVEKKKDIIATIQAGDTVSGMVQRLTNFGAFVDVGGVDGLVHISQISHEHVEHPEKVLSKGQTVQVKVLSVDRDSERISLSIKETLSGPWDQIQDSVAVGAIIEGTVKRLVSFGAFVEVLPGVEGLVHISQISDRHIGTPQEVLTVGETVKVKVLDVSEAERRVSLSIREANEDIERKETRSYEKSANDESSGFSLGDMIGDQLKKYRG
ncbi:small subunit ribosomal protein S1 [Alkalihalobacillus xiaoxiensis]|uniref:Small subunit ribosomal protein S1 n=1 Tax=Shouchella xiaoxiensis TaxID=766895 RepID=A0ABS2SY19_9BACI|nr:30S ribosomal protein S1 [Shouchella xiaoxiensis]MBM7840140.1 small subunit ribosomal protein S1 [Shouchella xiaoxiensis]